MLCMGAATYRQHKGARKDWYTKRSDNGAKLQRLSMHSIGRVGEKLKPVPTTFKANMQNDGFVSTTAGQNSRTGYCPTKADQNSKTKFLNCDDGKGEDNGKHLNEGSVHKSKGFRNVRFMQNQGIPKIDSSKCLEEAKNNRLEERMKHGNENRASKKMYDPSLSKPSLSSNFKIGQCSSDDQWKYIERETSTKNIFQPKPHHPLQNEIYFISENPKMGIGSEMDYE